MGDKQKRAIHMIKYLIRVTLIQLTYFLTQSNFLVYYKVLGTNILQFMLHTEGTKLIKHQYCSEKAIFDM